MSTLDVDVFVTLRPEPGSLLATPKPLFDYLKERGATMEGEYIVVAGWPVQFLPAANPLLEEALAQALEKDVAGISARVFTAEHLAAIALQTGRARDKARLLLFLESGALDPQKFTAIVRASRTTAGVGALRKTIPQLMTFDLAKIVQSKREFRQRAAARPIEEKLAMLDALRKRALAIRPLNSQLSGEQCERSDHRTGANQWQ